MEGRWYFGIIAEVTFHCPWSCLRLRVGSHTPFQSYPNFGRLVPRDWLATEIPINNPQLAPLHGSGGTLPNKRFESPMEWIGPEASASVLSTPLRRFTAVVGQNSLPFHVHGRGEAEVRCSSDSDSYVMTRPSQGYSSTVPQEK